MAILVRYSFAIRKARSYSNDVVFLAVYRSNPRMESSWYSCCCSVTNSAWLTAVVSPFAKGWTKIIKEEVHLVPPGSTDQVSHPIKLMLASLDIAVHLLSTSAGNRCIMGRSPDKPERIFRGVPNEDKR